MNKMKKEISREAGLEIGYILGKYFLKLDHLHYGYWADGLELDVTNLSKAQDAYADFVVSHIPEGVETILDVGCGTGQIASMLFEAGYKADCVCPSSVLRKRARELLGNKSQIFESTYEELQTENRYDMVLFCESFQYIYLQKAVSKTPGFLNDGGFLFICDIFRKDVEGKCVMGGPHKLGKFLGLMEDAPFEQIEDLDITEQTAPNIDILNHVTQEVMFPVIKAAEKFFHSRHPIILKLIKWKYRKKIAKTEQKYLHSNRTGEDFAYYKTYRLFSP